MVSKGRCSSCYDGRILDTEASNYKEVDKEIDKLYDGGQFSYYEAFVRITGKLGGTKKCEVCKGTGKAS
ncbi:hypothetical protein BC6307_21095 [Sutcliffiella cohnii]|uniref:Uncharacterized protein n=1 Tax=Sutcliffiella cohnii TaxID=33932 RepID=A0A223KVT1_9BACI|nr:hypothetical protein [Sutcliffiella cohnii]AST93585.1 hypothetical protein BC6307_21095 [Sutcliffiella cohnii]